MSQVVDWFERTVLHLVEMDWFIGWGVPFLTAAAAASFKALAKPNSSPRDLVLRRMNVPREDRAFGADLLFAAMGSQLAFMAIGDAKFRGLWIVLIFVLFGLPALRKWGWEDESGKAVPKEDMGVSLPNILGTLLLIYIYNLNA